ncbi:MAG: hypothetical protein ACYSR4_01720 [Planctomycetota bacterium]
MIATGEACFVSGLLLWGLASKVWMVSRHDNRVHSIERWYPHGLLDMKEIDFLPEWYKSGKRRQVNYRTQYFALGLILAAMLAWSAAAAHSISKAQAELAQAAAKEAQTKDASQEFAETKDRVTELQRRVGLMDEIDSKIDVSSVLAELSFLIDRKIVLKELTFSAEKFASRQEEKQNGGSAVRAANGKSAGGHMLPLGDVRFKVAISGVASDAGDVAELICKLEESPYFCHIIPSYSRNKQMRVGKNGAVQDLQVSEFELVCYLANYRQQDPHPAGAAQDEKLQRQG